jgi:hypothetical protein
MITIATITLISAGIAGLSIRYGAESRPGFSGTPHFDLR